LLKEQGNICDICKLKCKKYVLDHQHKRKRSDVNGVGGNGCIRGVLCDGCNRIEGLILLILFYFVFIYKSCFTSATMQLSFNS
jgi:hypothetical protein